MTLATDRAKERERPLAPSSGTSHERETKCRGHGCSFGWIHEMACPADNVLFVAELLNWRVQKLVLHA